MQQLSEGYWNALSEDEWRELRRQDITSTEVAALFNCSPYITHFELWTRKKGGTPEAWHENERMRWGKRLQDAIAAGVAEDEGWTIHSMAGCYRRHKEEPRMGASFDFLANDAQGKVFLLEVKNVDTLEYLRQWTDDEAPPHIEMQCQHQMEVADVDLCVIAVLVGGNELHLIYCHRDREIGEQLRQAVADFWASETAPEPDFARDAALVRALYVTSDPESFVDLSDSNRAVELCTMYENFAAVAKQAEEAKGAVSAELLTLIGRASRAKVGAYKISAGTVKEAAVSYTRKAYRNLRITKPTANNE